jgi:peroxiredoxin
MVKGKNSEKIQIRYFICTKPTITIVESNYSDQPSIFVLGLSVYNTIMPLELNQPAPEFTLPDLDGRIHMLSDYRGQIVIVNFWSAECPHSERFDADITARLPEWDVEVVLLSIASNANEPDEMVTEAARRRKVPILLKDADQSVADRYEAQTTPHVFVIDRKGILRYRGAVDDVAFRQRVATKFYLKDAVEALLDERDPEIREVQPFGCTIVRYT